MSFEIFLGFCNMVADYYLSAGAIFRNNQEITIHSLHSGLHTVQSHPGIGNPVDIDSPAIVFNNDIQDIILQEKFKMYIFSAGMFLNIIESFFNYQEQVLPDFRTKGNEIQVDIYFFGTGDPGAVFER